jgi:hypothetical protein
MDEEERQALMAEVTYYRELLSGAEDPVKVGACGYVIRHLEAKLAAGGLPVPRVPNRKPV